MQNGSFFGHTKFKLEGRRAILQLLPPLLMPWNRGFGHNGVCDAKAFTVLDMTLEFIFEEANTKPRENV